MKVNKMKNIIRNKLAMGVICLASALAGFGGGYVTGQKTQEVDYISVHSEGNYSGDYKAVRLHKLYGKDDIFVNMNRSNWETYQKDYFPMRKSIETSYGKDTDFSQRRIDNLHRLVRENK